MPTRTESCWQTFRGKAFNGLDDGKPGPDGTFRFVLMGLGPTEIGKHAIAHQLRDISVETNNVARNRILELAQDCAHFFGVEMGRQTGRTDEIDEHYGELASLGVARARRGW